MFRTPMQYKIVRWRKFEVDILCKIKLIDEIT